MSQNEDTSPFYLVDRYLSISSYSPYFTSSKTTTPVNQIVMCYIVQIWLFCPL
jgi:hypothetical protein